MVHRIIHRLKTINPWHFLWIGILSSILFGLILNTIQSYLWWGFLSRDLLLIGIIDCFFVPLLVAPLVIYFVLHAAKLEELNRALELEIIRVQEAEKKKGHETETLYRVLFENATIGIGIADTSGALIAFNNAMLAPGGYTRDDMASIGNVAGLYYASEERDRALAAFTKQGVLQQFPVQFKRRDGTPYDALLSLRPITYQDRPCIQAMVEDITERKQMEDALQKNERRYRELFEDSPIALCEIDLSAVKQYIASLEDPAAGDMKTYFANHPGALRQCAALISVVDMNNAMMDLFGADTKEALRQNLAAVFHEESYDHFREDILMLMADRKRHEHESVGQTLAGEKIHIFLKWFSAAGHEEAASRIIVSFIDITERTRAEKALHESEARLRQLSDNLPAGLVYQIDSGEDGQQRQFSYISAGVENLHGITAREAMNNAMSIYGQIIEEDRRRLAEEEAFALANLSVLQTEARLRLPSGEIRWRLFTSAPRRLANNRLVWDGIEIDITERKRAELALKESEDRFRIALHNSPIVVFNQDRNLRFTWIYNLRHGYAQEDVIGKTDADLLDIEEADRLTEIKRRVIESGAGEREEVRIRKAGELMYYDSSFVPLYGPEGSIIGLTCVAIDITTRKQHEELIRSYQEQLSLLTSRLSLVEEKERRLIAKDLHDNIGQILACAKLKLGELNESSHAECKPAVRQIYALVEQCILYTRALTAELSVPILYEMGLEPAVAWLGRQFQQNHSVQFHLRDDGAHKPLSESARIILYKAVRELLTNVAKHAHAKNVTVSLVRKDGSMQITVEDDGVGFDESDVRRGPRIQTCFGLFSIREALKNSGGSIEIVSAPGRSTRITLTAPIEK